MNNKPTEKPAKLRVYASGNSSRNYLLRETVGQTFFEKANYKKGSL